MVLVKGSCDGAKVGEGEETKAGRKVGTEEMDSGMLLALKEMRSTLLTPPERQTLMK